ncbi:hypothetical protein BCR39DRAFT_555363 [Naematelia encephala]|uniref:Uncharacterized protein n=1 Tax=Naematelia encephala TaxID=71784 RepID=A0A1Y2AD00_9TREE|nr:hypothetical protein BCR39DRAFT_555363 [Naematelia encephala]
MSESQGPPDQEDVPVASSSRLPLPPQAVSSPSVDPATREDSAGDEDNRDKTPPVYDINQYVQLGEEFDRLKGHMREGLQTMIEAAYEGLSGVEDPEYQRTISDLIRDRLSLFEDDLKNSNTGRSGASQYDRGIAGSDARGVAEGSGGGVAEGSGGGGAEGSGGVPDRSNSVDSIDLIITDLLPRSGSLELKPLATLSDQQLIDLFYSVGSDQVPPFSSLPEYENKEPLAQQLTGIPDNPMYAAQRGEFRSLIYGSISDYVDRMRVERSDQAESDNDSQEDEDYGSDEESVQVEGREDSSFVGEDEDEDD